MRVRRLPVLDELTRDGETVVLLGERAVLLSPLASAALADIGSLDWTSDVGLIGSLVARFGPVDDVGSVVFSLVSELAEAGLVELG
jgi:hypothetical protein